MGHSKFKLSEPTFPPPFPIEVQTLLGVLTDTQTKCRNGKQEVLAILNTCETPEEGLGSLTRVD